MYVFDFDGTLVRRDKPYSPMVSLYILLSSSHTEIWTAGDYWDHNIKDWFELQRLPAPDKIRTRLGDLRPSHVLKLSWALEPTTPDITLLFDDSEFICRHLSKHHINTVHVI